MVHFLLHSGGRTLMLFDAILKLVFLIAQRRELFLEFGAIAKQVNQLVVILRLFRLCFE